MGPCRGRSRKLLPIALQRDFRKPRLTTAVLAITLIENRAKFPFLSCRIPRSIRIAANISTLAMRTNNVDWLARSHNRYMLTLPAASDQLANGYSEAPEDLVDFVCC